MIRIQKFYKCNECGNIIGVINNTGIPMTCCSQEMEELLPNKVTFSNYNSVKSQILTPTSISGSTSNSKIFQVKKDYEDNSISIIVDKKYLEPNSLCWAYLKTEQGGQRKNLIDKDYPVLTFKVVDDTPQSAYFYCSNHGLFKMDF